MAYVADTVPHGVDRDVRMRTDTMGSKTQDIVAPGIHRPVNGSFRVRVAVGDRKRGGQQKETAFSAGTGLREMKAWQTKERAAMLRQGLVPVRGTLEGDIPNYLARVKRKLAHPMTAGRRSTRGFSDSVRGDGIPSHEMKFAGR